MRYLPQYRDTKQAIENIRLLSSAGERVSLAQLCKIDERDGASEIYREENQRYVAIKYSVRGRDLGSTVEEAMEKVNKQVQLPLGYHIDWEGEYESQKRAQRRLLIVLPLTMLIIFMILYTMFKSFKWALLILANVCIAPIGRSAGAPAHAAPTLASRPASGFLALFGVSVQTGVIMLEYINQLRARRLLDRGGCRRRRGFEVTADHDDHAGGDAWDCCPRPLSHAIGSDSQRPFAIVIVGGLIAALLMSIFLLPTLYVWIAGELDILPPAEEGFEVGEHVD